jgi:hypothetical protein
MLLNLIGVSVKTRKIFVLFYFEVKLRNLGKSHGGGKQIGVADRTGI